MEERVVLPEKLKEEKTLSSQEKVLRPGFLKDFLGQKLLKKKLKLFIEAARYRKEALDHVLLVGPPGLGKTTLASIIAHELGSQIYVLSGPNIEKKADLAAILTHLQPGNFLFVDEIHRLPRAMEEVLYSAMEDFRLDIIIGQGPGAKALQLPIAPFTLIGATTRSGLLSSPLRDRFGVQLRLDFYPPEELKQIVLRSSNILSLVLEERTAFEIARRSRGTPRISNRLLRRVRDYVEVERRKQSKGKENLFAPVRLEEVRAALSLLEIDEVGLDGMDRKFLKILIEKFQGGPVGIETLASAMGEERDTLEEVCEPYLLQQGFLQRTIRGRVATAQAYGHLGFQMEKEKDHVQGDRQGREISEPCL